MGLSLLLHMLESAKAAKDAVEAKHQYEHTKAKLDAAITASHHLMRMQQTSLEASGTLEKRLGVTAESLERINAASREMAGNQATLLETQKRSEARLKLGQLRSALPLEPLSIYFERETPMDDPDVAPYIQGLRKLIPEWPVSRFFPAREQLTDPSYNTLLMDYTQFAFTRGEGARRSAVVFACWSEAPKTAMTMLTLPYKAEPRVEVNLIADFYRNVLVQKVVCRNLLRTGNDVASSSSLDLIGRRMTWGRFPELMKVDFSTFLAGIESFDPQSQILE